MTYEEIRTELEEYSKKYNVPDEGCGYLSYHHDGTITLDGAFTLENLQAIVALMQKRFT